MKSHSDGPSYIERGIRKPNEEELERTKKKRRKRKSKETLESVLFFHSASIISPAQEANEEKKAKPVEEPSIE